MISMYFYNNLSLFSTVFTDPDVMCMLDLLDQGARVNDADDQGETALHYAARWARADEAKLLCDRGADPNAKDKTGMYD